MKNVPEKIYLNLGQMTEGEWDEVKDQDFNSLRNDWEITWCEDKVFEHDIEFVRADIAATWHSYEKEKPEKALMVFVIYKDTSIDISQTVEGKEGFTLPKSERGYEPMYWMEMPPVPEGL